MGVGLFRLAVLVAVSILIAASPAAANDSGQASEYSITMSKVELCSDSACTTAVTLSDGSRSFDIASSSAGADVGSYAEITGLRTGDTFSHVRVTISRTFTITGYADDTGTGNGWCRTNAGAQANNTTFAPGNHEANGTDAENNAVSQSMTIMDDNQGAPGPSTNDAGNLGAAWNYNTPTFATSMTISGNDVLLIYAMSSPFTVAEVMPTVEVKFNTSTAMGVHKTAANNAGCNLYPAEPSVTITVK